MIQAFDPAVKVVVLFGTETTFQLGSREPAGPSPVFMSEAKKQKKRQSKTFNFSIEDFGDLIKQPSTPEIGDIDGEIDGDTVGATVGETVGADDGSIDGRKVGDAVGLAEGAAVGAKVGSIEGL